MNGKILWSKLCRASRRATATEQHPLPLFTKAAFTFKTTTSNSPTCWRSTSSPAKRSGELSRATSPRPGPPPMSGGTRNARKLSPRSNKVRSYDLDGKLLWEIEACRASHCPHRSPSASCSMSPPVSTSPPPDRLRRSPRASGDINPAAGTTSNEYLAWSLPQAARITLRRPLRRTPLHLVRSRLLHLPRRRHRPKKSMANAASKPAAAISPAPPGPTTERSSASAKAEYLCDQRRPRLQGPWQEFPQRNVHGHTRFSR